MNINPKELHRVGHLLLAISQFEDNEIGSTIPFQLLEKLSQREVKAVTTIINPMRLDSIRKHYKETQACLKKTV